MRVCFDLDGTLCNTPYPDYANATPKPGAKALLDFLKLKGDTIIIHTARGSASGKDLRELTIRQLEDWDFDYDEIYFGKPAADVYLDDKAFTGGNVDLMSQILGHLRRLGAEKHG